VTRLVITPLAENDIEEIGDYIAKDNPNRAVSFIAELRGQCRKLALSPQAYRLRHELGNDVRASVYGNYMIFFNYDEKDVRILRILHSARNLPAQFDP